MGKNKVDAVYLSIYSKFAQNPTQNRKAIIQRMYMRILTELAVNRFKWEGFPTHTDEKGVEHEDIDIRFLELTLFNQALCVFFHDDELDHYMAMRGASVGAINMYDNPTSFTVTGNESYNKTLDYKECVPIWANYLRVPDLDVVSVYSGRLAEIDRTAEIQVMQTRRPYIVTAPETQRATVQNVFKQMQDGEIAVFGTDQFDPTSMFNILPTTVDSKSVIDTLTAKNKVWGECMTLLGINNANQDKKERLVESEVSANDDQVMASRMIALTARQQACKQINQQFGLDVSVDWNYDVQEPESPKGEGTDIIEGELVEPREIES